MKGAWERKTSGSGRDVLRQVARGLQAVELEIILVLTIGIAIFVVRGFLVSVAS